VHGKTYDPARGVPPMTAFRNLLNDEELAAYSPLCGTLGATRLLLISARDCQTRTGGTRNQTTFWKPDDLMAAHPLEPEPRRGGGSAETLFSNDCPRKRTLGNPAC
jgi:hypothetical protein